MIKTIFNVSIPGIPAIRNACRTGLKTVALALSLMVGKETATAQCCVTNMLTVSTGYNPVTTNSVTPNCNGCTPATDPEWTITVISNPLLGAITGDGYTAVSTPGPADVIIPDGSWVAPGLNSCYISCFNATAVNDGNCSMTFTATRNFTLLCDACISYNLNVADDNWITSISIDGTVIYGPESSGARNYLSFTSIANDPNDCISLAAGVHTLTVVENEDCAAINAIGFDLWGYLYSSINTFKSEASACCNSYTCTEPPITGATSVCVGGTIALANAEGCGTWSSSDLTVATIDPVLGTVTGVNGGTVTITYTDNCGRQVFYTITVIAPPVITGYPVVVGFTTTFTAAPPGGTWSASPLAVGSVDGSGDVTGISPGVLTISYVSPAGCLGVYTTTVSASCCLTNALVINTGYNPITTNSVTPNCNGCTPATDPEWTITAISSTMAAAATGDGYTPVTTPGAADVIIPDGSWIAPGANSCYISCFNATAVNDGTCSMTFTATRNFTLACDACITYNINTADDNWISGIYIDGTLIYGPESSGTRNYRAFVNTTVGVAGCISLPAGVHQISVVENEDCASVNAVGFDLWGTLNSTTYAFVSEASACCKSFTCTEPPIKGPSQLCVGATITLTDAESCGEWTSSNSAVATIDPVTGLVTGISAGTVTITYTDNCGRQVFYTVTVNPTPVISGSPVVVFGVTAFTATPPGGTWSSGDVAVATVDGSGNVVGVAPGTVIISYVSPAGCIGTYVATVTTNCCIANSLVINTGYDPVTTNSITPNCNGCAAAVDPNWTITAISAPLLTAISGDGYTAVSTPGQADVIIPDGAWIAPGPNSCYISCFNSESVDDGSCGMTFTATRNFRLVCNACITYNFNTANDNWISAIYLDGTLIYGPESSSAHNYLAFVNTAITGCIVLGPGMHTITVVENEDCYYVNAIGFDLWGTLNSSIPAFQSESSVCCRSYTCSEPPIAGPATLCVGDMATYTDGEACGTWSSSNPAIASIDLVYGTLTGNAVGATILTYTDNCGRQVYYNVTVNDCVLTRKANPGTGAAANAALTIVPNPNNGTFTLSGAIQGAGNATQVSLEIDDMLGQTVYTGSAAISNGAISKVISLSGMFADGVYLVKVTSGSNVQTLRFSLGK